MRNPAPDRIRRALIKSLTGLGGLALTGIAIGAQSREMLIDDFRSGDFISALGTQWRAVSDQVMGGISEGLIAYDTLDGRQCLRLTGDVSLENNGGFIQAAADLSPSGGTLDASGYDGLRLIVRGNNEQYSVHLRTPDNSRPWQSYRAHFSAPGEWQTIDLPFGAFTPYRLEAPLDLTRLRRIGLVAIGRAFQADLAIAGLMFYRNT